MNSLEQIAADIADFQIERLRDDIIEMLQDKGYGYQTVGDALTKIDAALKPIREKLYSDQLAQVRKVHNSGGANG